MPCLISGGIYQKLICLAAPKGAPDAVADYGVPINGAITGGAGFVPIADGKGGEMGSSSETDLRRWRSTPELRMIEDFPPILTVVQAAELLQIQPSTLYSRVSQGFYKRATKRGNPLRFHRDLLVREFFKDR